MPYLTQAGSLQSEMPLEITASEGIGLRPVADPTYRSQEVLRVVDTPGAYRAFYTDSPYQWADGSLQDPIPILLPPEEVFALSADDGALITDDQDQIVETY